MVIAVAAYTLDGGNADLSEDAELREEEPLLLLPEPLKERDPDPDEDLEPEPEDEELLAAGMADRTSCKQATSDRAEAAPFSKSVSL